MTGGVAKAGALLTLALEIHGYRAVSRALTAITDALPIDDNEVFERLVDWWEAWLDHPDCWDDGIGSVFSPTVVGVFTHEEGIRGDESYIVGGLQDVISAIDWGERTLGEFHDVEPIWPGMALPEFARYRQMVISTSPKGAGNAYECRMELKRLLPPAFHKWLTWARKANNQPKYRLLEPLALDSVDLTRLRAWVKDRDNWPGWYTDWKKGELLVQGSEMMPDQYWQRLVGDRTDVITGNRIMPPEILCQLRDYMDPMDFWRSATGKVKSTEVAGLINHQLELPLER